jgi:hypothetical protein
MRADLMNLIGLAIDDQSVCDAAALWLRSWLAAGGS